MSIIVDLYKAFSGMREVKSEAWCQDGVKTEAMVLHAEWLRAFSAYLNKPKTDSMFGLLGAKKYTAIA